MNPHRWRPQPHHNIRHHTCPEPRVKRAFPKTLPASPVFTGTSSLPPRQPSIYAGFRPPMAETPISRGFPANAHSTVCARFSARSVFRQAFAVCGETAFLPHSQTKGSGAPPKSVRYPVSISAIAPRLKAQSASARSSAIRHPPSAIRHPPATFYDSGRPSAYNSRVRSTMRFLACFPACFLGCFPPC